MNAKKRKTSLSARVAWVVKELIRAERWDGESDGQFIERLVLQNIATERGRRILETHAEQDPLARATLSFQRISE